MRMTLKTLIMVGLMGIKSFSIFSRTMPATDKPTMKTSNWFHLKRKSKKLILHIKWNNNLVKIWFNNIKSLFKLVSIDWSLLNSTSYTYTHCFSLIGDNFISNCYRCMVQPFISFRSNDNFFWKIPILKNYHPERVFDQREGGPTKTETLYWLNISISK